MKATKVMQKVEEVVVREIPAVTLELTMDEAGVLMGLLNAGVLWSHGEVGKMARSVYTALTNVGVRETYLVQQRRADGTDTQQWNKA